MLSRRIIENYYYYLYKLILKQLSKIYLNAGQDKVWKSIIFSLIKNYLITVF